MTFRVGSKAVVLALACACAAGCANDGDRDTKEAIEKALVAAWDSSTKTVDVSNIVRGDWTRLVFACAYSFREEVEKNLGFAWPEYSMTEQDGAQTWIFATDDEVVKWAVIDGPKGDPCGTDTADREYVVPRHEARFRLDDTGYGRALRRIP